MSKTVISTDKAPAAIGTYSQAIKVGPTVYLSGQIQPGDKLCLERHFKLCRLNEIIFDGIRRPHDFGLLESLYALNDPVLQLHR